MTVAEFALYLSSKILAEIFWAVINPQIISHFEGQKQKQAADKNVQGEKDQREERDTSEIAAVKLQIPLRRAAEVRRATSGVHHGGAAVEGRRQGKP